MRQIFILLTLTMVCVGIAATYRVDYLDELCYSTSNGIYAELNKGNLSALVLKGQQENSTTKYIRCTIEIKPHDVNKFILRIKIANFTDDNCINNSLTISPFNISSREPYDMFKRKYCNQSDLNDNNEFIFSRGMTANISVAFQVLMDNINLIEIVLVVFEDERCTDLFEFPCPNGICISNSLVCDGYDHCGDDSDEFNSREDCRYERRLCYDRGAVSYELAVNKPEIIILAGGIIRPYTHEICYYEILTRDISGKVVFLHVVQMEKLYGENDCSIMLLVYEDGKIFKTYCNGNTTLGSFTVLPGNNTIEVYSHMMLHAEVEYEIRFIVAKKGTCEGDFDFSCNNGYCISSKFICDGYNHCEHGEDESRFLLECYPIYPIIYTSIMVMIWLVWYVWKRKRERAAKNNSTVQEGNSDTTTSLQQHSHHTANAANIMKSDAPRLQNNPLPAVD